MITTKPAGDKGYSKISGDCFNRAGRRPRIPSDHAKRLIFGGEKVAGLIADHAACSKDGYRSDTVFHRNGFQFNMTMHDRLWKNMGYYARTIFRDLKVLSRSSQQGCVTTTSFDETLIRLPILKCPPSSHA